jgi:hypothetical protein
MRPKPSLWYEARVTLGFTSLLPLLGLPAYALFTWLLAWNHWSVVQAPDIVMAFEIILPLCAGLAAAHLMSVERDAGFDELRRTYAESPWRLPLLRTLSALFITLTALLLGLLAFYLAFGLFPFQEALITALPPALFVLGLAMLVNHLSGSYWAGAGTVMAYWFMEITTRGKVTGAVFLFAGTLGEQAETYLLNRWLLVGIALLLLALNAWIYALRPGWRGMRKDALADG